MKANDKNNTVHDREMTIGVLEEQVKDLDMELRDRGYSLAEIEAGSRPKVEKCALLASVRAVRARRGKILAELRALKGADE